MGSIKKDELGTELAPDAVTVGEMKVEKVSISVRNVQIRKTAR